MSLSVSQLCAGFRRSSAEQARLETPAPQSWVWRCQATTGSILAPCAPCCNMYAPLQAAAAAVAALAAVCRVSRMDLLMPEPSQVAF